jgi:hypothetical protein
MPSEACSAKRAATRCIGLGPDLSKKELAFTGAASSFDPHAGGILPAGFVRSERTNAVRKAGMEAPRGVSQVGGAPRFDCTKSIHQPGPVGVIQ